MYFEGLKSFFDLFELFENDFFNAMQAFEQTADVARGGDIRVAGGFFGPVVDLLFEFDDGIGVAFHGFAECGRAHECVHAGAQSVEPLSLPALEIRAVVETND